MRSLTWAGHHGKFGHFAHTISYGWKAGLLCTFSGRLLPAGLGPAGLGRAFARDLPRGRDSTALGVGSPPPEDTACTLGGVHTGTAYALPAGIAP